jgi:hypothetical protein
MWTRPKPRGTTRFAAAVAAAVLSVCAVSFWPQVAHAEEERNPELIKTFKETHQCPSTGRTATKGVSKSYTCTGYVVDHGIPFCAGQYLGFSVDQMYNLSYQKYDKDNSLRKDKDEVKLCALLKKLTAGNSQQ